LYHGMAKRSEMDGVKLERAHLLWYNFPVEIRIG
jgi:hypothetical protein